MSPGPLWLPAHHGGHPASGDTGQPQAGPAPDASTRLEVAGASEEVPFLAGNGGLYRAELAQPAVQGGTPQPEMGDRRHGIQRERPEALPVTGDGLV
ncbi:hypothetical protein BDAG_00317 [Burkholderia dolosa AU0158]|nr:hypothetical protein BDAG_00317 [Burkholderia dolosa AU0158]